jgi:hypothetical protein
MTSSSPKAPSDDTITLEVRISRECKDRDMCSSSAPFPYLEGARHETLLPIFFFLMMNKPYFENNYLLPSIPS